MVVELNIKIKQHLGESEQKKILTIVMRSFNNAILVYLVISYNINNCLSPKVNC
jgi:hypothetical protein